MALTQKEILPLVFALAGVILAIVAMAVGWFTSTGTITPFRVCDVWTCYTFRADFAQATAAFLVIGFLCILVAAILILLFGLVEKLRTRTVRLAVIVLSALAGVCLLLSFCIWLGWYVDGLGGRVVKHFGAGLWIDLVAAIASFVTAALTHVMIQ